MLTRAVTEDLLTVVAAAVITAVIAALFFNTADYWRFAAASVAAFAGGVALRRVYLVVRSRRSSTAGGRAT